jgi:transcription elongation GreA/GreB family factor
MQEELERLLKVERPRNIRDIEEARAHGDLS